MGSALAVLGVVALAACTGDASTASTPTTTATATPSTKPTTPYASAHDVAATIAARGGRQIALTRDHGTVVVDMVVPNGQVAAFASPPAGFDAGAGGTGPFILGTVRHLSATGSVAGEACEASVTEAEDPLRPQLLTPSEVVPDEVRAGDQRLMRLFIC